MQPHLKRRLAPATVVFALAFSACSQSPISPPPPTGEPGNPQPPSPGNSGIPAPGGVVGAIDVTSRLTATGAYEYTIQVKLTEQAGLASVVTNLAAIADCDCGPMGPSGPHVEISAPAAWVGDDNHIAPYGTLTSKPLIIRDETPDLYAAWAVVGVGYDDGSSRRSLELIAPMPPHPGPPTEDRITMEGVVRDSVTKEAVGGVLVRITSGPDAMRETRTDALGRFAIEGIRTGRFRVSLNKPGYFGEDRSVFLLTSGTHELIVKKG